MKTMSFPFLLLLSSTALVASEPDTLAAFGIPYNQFYCGPSANKSIIDQAIAGLNSTCPAAAPELNHCCAVHDDCYLNKRGRNACDEQFCSCLDYVGKHVEHATQCNGLNLVTGYACIFVKSLDDSAYKLNASLEIFAHKNVPLIAKISKDYAELYEACSTQQVTLGSCALNYNICGKKNSTDCAVRLIRCLDDTQNGRAPNATCDKSIESVQNKLFFSEEANLTTPEIIVLTIERKITKTKLFVVRVYRKASRPGSSIYFYLVFMASIFVVGVLVIVACVLMDRTEEEDTGAVYPMSQSTGTEKSSMSTSARYR